MAKFTDWIKEKAEDAKVRIDCAKWKVRNWAMEHPEQATAIIVAIGGATGAVIKGVYRDCKRHREMREMEELKDLRIFDHSLGKYWPLKRKPTVAENLQIERMRSAGMKYGDILTQLNLL